MQMNPVDLIRDATKAGEDFSKGKADGEIRESVASAARSSYLRWLSAAKVSITDEADWRDWRYTFAVACFR